MIGSTAGATRPRPLPPFAGDRRIRCGPEHDGILFPDRPSQQANEAATKLCKPCPLRRDCLSHALRHEPFWGSWGGFSPAQRRLIASGRMKVVV